MILHHRLIIRFQSNERNHNIPISDTLNHRCFNLFKGQHGLCLLELMFNHTM